MRGKGYANKAALDPYASPCKSIACTSVFCAAAEILQKPMLTASHVYHPALQTALPLSQSAHACLSN